MADCVNQIRGHRCRCGFQSAWGTPTHPYHRALTPPATTDISGLCANAYPAGSAQRSLQAAPFDAFVIQAHQNHPAGPTPSEPVVNVWARHQLLRFIVVGCGNTAFSFGVYAALLGLGTPYAAATGLSYIAGLALGFRTQGRIVFHNPDRRLIGRFLLAWLVIFLINIALIAGLKTMGLNGYQAGALSLLPVTALSYGMQRFLVFKVPKPLGLNP